jgi:hypothetical protein
MKPVSPPHLGGHTPETGNPFDRGLWREARDSTFKSCAQNQLGGFDRALLFDHSLQANSDISGATVMCSVAQAKGKTLLFWAEVADQ